MIENIFTSLAVVVGVVLVTIGVMKYFKQPMIIWYILAWIILSIFLPDVIRQNIAIESFSNLGIAFLLFIVGMELNPAIIKDLGRTSLIVGVVQVFVTAAAGFGLSCLLGIDQITSAYIWLGLAISSTIVVLKLLTDQDQTESTHWRLAIGILIVQDVIVMLLFLVLATFGGNGEGANIATIGAMLGKMILLWWAVYTISKYIIPWLTKKIAESQEYLFLFAIGRCFILWSVFYRLGFGIEIGTLVAGMTLASSSYRFEITSRVKSLRDFFIVMFFVLLGTKVDFGSIVHYIPQVIGLTLFVLILKPIIIMWILWILWHTKKNNFLAGSSLAQISEFSFLLLAMWVASWAIAGTHTLSVITLVGLLTIAWSSYYIIYGKRFYRFCKNCAKYIPGKHNDSYKEHIDKEYEVLLFWFGKFGSNLYDNVVNKYETTLIIDEHPGIIGMLQKKWLPCIYGDAWDISFLEELPIKKTKLVISTIKKFEENMIILKTLKYHHPSLIVILVSHHVEESIKLYEEGADYVIMPHFLGAYHASLMLEEYGFDIEKFSHIRNNQVNELRSKHKDMMIEALHSGRRSKE